MGLCKRGVLYVTSVCGLKCKFCYYIFNQSDNQVHPDFYLLKKEADRQRFEYDLEAVDLTGGEPTLHPDIEQLVNYCNMIGLKPTIITNGQLTEVIEDLIKKHPDELDLLISIHDIEENYEKITGVKGSWKRMKKTLEMLKEKKFKFRVNCTVTKFNLNRLREVIDITKKYGGRMVDFILFNPHEGTKWKDKDADFQATYSEAAEKIKDAIDYSDLIINVRYIPLCMMKGYEKHVINFFQWIYDEYGWEESHGNNLPKFTEEQQHLAFVKQKIMINHKKQECATCVNVSICDGIHPQYANKFGTDEFIPLEGAFIVDPMFYRR